MARAAGTAKKAAGSTPEKAPKAPRATKGHNLPKLGKITADDVRVYAQRLIELQAAKEAAQKAIKDHRAKWSMLGMPLQIVDKRLKRSNWKPQEITEDWDTERFVAESLGQPIGKQLELLGSDATPVAVKEGLRWRAEGRMHGLLGKGAPEKPPEGCPPEHDGQYAEGWLEGQAETQQAVLRNMEKANGTAVN